MNAYLKYTNYDRIDVSEEVDINTASALKKSNVCHYWHFLNFSFKFQPNVCNGCHDFVNGVCKLYRSCYFRH